MVYYNGENVVRLGPLVKRILPLAAGAAVIGGLVYSFWLSKKLSVLIGSIRKISQHSYEPVKEKCVFGEVYRSLNKMDRELRRSEKLQEETDRTRKECDSEYADCQGIFVWRESGAAQRRLVLSEL